MFRDLVKTARLLNDLVIAKSIYGLVKLGYNPTSLYNVLSKLIDYGFVTVSVYNGVKYYHLTGLGAEYLKILRKSVLHRITMILEEKGIRYRVWWGDSGVRASMPIVYVDEEIEIPFNTDGIVRIEVKRNDGVSKKN